jgi:pimeloyl-ACP methyl ester carboxylesterase
MISTMGTAQIARSQDGTAISYQTLGAGEGVIVLGGAWRSGRDYLAFAGAMSRYFAVHVVDRRDRGDSGPQGENYNIERELEDVFAVQTQTDATIVFGHSYGGLIALEAARRSDAFSDVLVYEPGVSVAGSMPLAWMAPYRKLLVAGDRRGAFAAMVRGAGGAPPALERMPLWYVKLMLRLFGRASGGRSIRFSKQRSPSTSRSKHSTSPPPTATGPSPPAQSSLAATRAARSSRTLSSTR